MWRIDRVLASLAIAILAGSASLVPAIAGGESPLIGRWCTDFGYRIAVGETAILFEDDRVSENPPPAYAIRFAADGQSVEYRQDFRDTILPWIDVIDCTLRRQGAGRAEETCAGPGTGFMTFVALRRCDAAPVG